ncbi:MAG: hypothetical protein R2729_11155 [Bryobacteraceae bacterium]
MIASSIAPDAVRELDETLSRRLFFKRTWTAAGLAAGFGLFQSRGRAAARSRAVSKEIALAVMGAMGDIVIPVDQDPGYASFEPGISQYALDGFLLHFVLAGNQRGFDTVLGALEIMNDAPEEMDYGPKFLAMTSAAREQYYTDCLTGGFENDGYGDVLGLASFLGLFLPKAVFFSNYPNHIARPGSDIQVFPASAIKTGFDISGFRGPIQADEEQRLRDRFLGIEVLPGIDRTNPFL